MRTAALQVEVTRHLAFDSPVSAADAAALAESETVDLLEAASAAPLQDQADGPQPAEAALPSLPEASSDASPSSTALTPPGEEQPPTSENWPQSPVTSAGTGENDPVPGVDDVLDVLSVLSDPLS